MVAPVMEAPQIQTSRTSSAVKLARSVRRADKFLKSFRTQQVKFVKTYAGPYYGKGFKSRQPLAMIYSLVSILLPNLVVEPRVNITTDDMSLHAFANTLRVNVNKALSEILFDDTMREVTLDAIFGMGITKTGLGPTATGNNNEAGNYVSDPDKVFVERVSLEDYVADIDAKARSSMSFEGNRYQTPFEWAMESGLYDTEKVELLRRHWALNREQKTSQIAHDEPMSDEVWREDIELLDIWLPDKGMVVTLPGDPDITNDYLAEKEYEGPEFGPYDTFGFNPVPDNLMPIPIVSTIYDLAEAINSIARKIKRQAETQKDVLAVTAGHEEDGETVRTADDGDAISVTDVEALKMVSFGGVNNDNYQSVAWLRDFFNLVSGNPELLGGIGPQANTAAQDEQSLQSASVRVADWRRQVLKTAGKVARKVAWYEWTDPENTRRLTLTLPNGVDVPVRWSPELREGDFLDYNFEIDPYPKKSTDPEAQYRKTMEWLTNVALPLSQIGAPQGMLLDVERIAQITSQQLGIPGAEGMFRRGQPMQAPASGGGGMGGQQTRSPDNREVRRMPAKPPPVKTQAEEAGVET